MTYAVIWASTLDLLYTHNNVWANSHLFGQPELPDTLLAQVGDLTRFYQAMLAGGGGVARASTLEGSSFPRRVV